MTFVLHQTTCMVLDLLLCFKCRRVVLQKLSQGRGRFARNLFLSLCSYEVALLSHAHQKVSQALHHTQCENREADEEEEEEKEEQENPPTHKTPHCNTHHTHTLTCAAASGITPALTSCCNASSMSASSHVIFMPQQLDMADATCHSTV